MSDQKNNDARSAANTSDSIESGAELTTAQCEQAKALALLQQRRRVLKAAAIAAPMLVTLHAKSAFAGPGRRRPRGTNKSDPQAADEQSQAASGLAYGPGAYINGNEGQITPP